MNKHPDRVDDKAPMEGLASWLAYMCMKETWQPDRKRLARWALEVEASTQTIKLLTAERDRAREQVARSQAVAGVPQGWRLVPVEPTEEMIRAYLDCQDTDPTDPEESYVYNGWKAMLEAAPPPPDIPPPQTEGEWLEEKTRQEWERIAIERAYDYGAALFVPPGNGGSATANVHMRAAALLAHLRKKPQAPPDAIRQLLMLHATKIEEGNDYAYFELAYTRQTGWMAWITDNPARGEPGTVEFARSRKVIARGQGDTPDEACADAISATQGEPNV